VGEHAGPGIEGDLFGVKICVGLDGSVEHWKAGMQWIVFVCRNLQIGSREVATCEIPSDSCTAFLNVAYSCPLLIDGAAAELWGILE
jgi:hypothetical protein